MADPQTRDQLDVVALTRALVDIDSTTGSETEVGRWLAAYLRARGFAVQEQPVDDRRFNIYAASSSRTPVVVLSTHFDCVPPFFPSRIEGDRVYGRGTCDAKGILAAQVTAAEGLRAEGCGEFALLFVVGEERGSDGAAAANAESPGSRYLLNGEPTELRLGAATRGILRLRLRASGRAAHSSSPELGESAIDKLIDALVALRRVDLPEDSLLGRTYYTVGLIEGGVAPNVIAPAAEAEVLFRTVGPGEDIRRRMTPIERFVDIEHILEVPAVRLKTVSGYETATLAYTTDIGFLGRWGEPLLFGPGSVSTAHTAHEFVSIEDLWRAVAVYRDLTRTLIAEASSRSE